VRVGRACRSVRLYPHIKPGAIPVSNLQLWQAITYHNRGLQVCRQQSNFFKMFTSKERDTFEVILESMDTTFAGKTIVTDIYYDIHGSW